MKHIKEAQNQLVKYKEIERALIAERDNLQALYDLKSQEYHSIEQQLVQCQRELEKFKRQLRQYEKEGHRFKAGENQQTVFAERRVGVMFNGSTPMSGKI